MAHLKQAHLKFCAAKWWHLIQETEGGLLDSIKKEEAAVSQILEH